jgi:hypothetical protein
MKIRSNTVLILLFLLFCGSLAGQTARRANCPANSPLNGVYQIDVDRSDELFSVIENASSNVPYSEQQIFFIDLAVRLTPPDLLAIECRGNRVSLGSSRAPRVEFTADGVSRTARNSEGHAVRSRIAFERDNLTFDSRGGRDNLSFTFTPLDGGRSLRVTRRISARELNVPVIIQTIYNKVGETARWDIFDNSQIARQNRGSETAPSAPAPSIPRTREREPERPMPTFFARRSTVGSTRRIDATSAGKWLFICRSSKLFTLSETLRSMPSAPRKRAYSPGRSQSTSAPPNRKSFFRTADARLLCVFAKNTASLTGREISAAK